MNWGVMELRKWLRERMMVNMKSVITIEEKVGECETDLRWDLLSGGQIGVQGLGDHHMRRLGTTSTSYKFG